MVRVRVRDRIWVRATNTQSTTRHGTHKITEKKQDNGREDKARKGKTTQGKRQDDNCNTTPKTNREITTFTTSTSRQQLRCNHKRQDKRTLKDKIRQGKRTLKDKAKDKANRTLKDNARQR
jgi:hypothetical protein